MKDKLLCALENMIGSDLIQCRNDVITFPMKGSQIRLGYDNTFKKVVEKTIETKWWGKQYTIKTEKSIITGRKYYIAEGYCWADNKFEITKMEYDDLFRLRKEAVLRKKIKQLDSLCNSEN